MGAQKTSDPDRRAATDLVAPRTPATAPISSLRAHPQRLTDHRNPRPQANQHQPVFSHPQGIFLEPDYQRQRHHPVYPTPKPNSPGFSSVPSVLSGPSVDLPALSSVVRGQELILRATSRSNSARRISVSPSIPGNRSAWLLMRSICWVASSEVIQSFFSSSCLSGKDFRTRSLI